MKKVLIGILLEIALIVSIVAIVFYLTADVPRSGDSYFAVIRDGNAKDAYQSTSRGFRQQRRKTSLWLFSRALGLQIARARSGPHAPSPTISANLRGRLKLRLAVSCCNPRVTVLR